MTGEGSSSLRRVGGCTKLGCGDHLSPRQWCHLHLHAAIHPRGKINLSSLMTHHAPCLSFLPLVFSPLVITYCASVYKRSHCSPSSSVIWCFWVPATPLADSPVTSHPVYPFSSLSVASCHFSPLLLFPLLSFLGFAASSLSALTVPALELAPSVKCLSWPILWTAGFLGWKVRA